MTIGTLNMKEFFQKVKFIALVECVWGKHEIKVIVVDIFMVIMLQV